MVEITDVRILSLVAEFLAVVGIFFYLGFLVRKTSRKKENTRDETK